MYPLLETKLSRVVTGVFETMDTTGSHPSQIDKILKDNYGVEHHTAMETNGWQNDFWITYLINDVEYEYSGSWYYGSSSFSKK